MRTKNFHGQRAALNFFVLLVLSLSLCLLTYGYAVAQQPKAESGDTAKYLGAETCRRCHTTPGADKPDLVLLTEYATWRTEDKHSLAYAVLEGSRGQRIGELLAGAKDYVLKPEAGCLGCHSMHFPERMGSEFDPKEGVSCDGCHGPSSNWLTPHYTDKPAWRKKSPQEKTALGMRDLRDPVIKAKLCMSCHVGSVEEGKVITHSMYAAGHPPLPSIEPALFCKHLPQHWMDLKDVPFLKTAPDEIKKQYRFDTAEFQDTLVALVGSGIAFREQMHLVSSRADLTAKEGKKAWPELALPAFATETNPEQIWPQVAMAHSGCYACHHELKRPSWRQERGYGLRLLEGGLVDGIAGRPQVSRWTLDLLEIGLRETGQNKADTQRVFSEAKVGLGELYSAFNARPFGDPKAVRQASELLRNWCTKVTHDKLAPARFDKGSQLRLLHLLCSLPEGSYPDFDTARQIAAALQIVYEEWSPRDGAKQGNGQKIAEILENLDRTLNLWSFRGSDASKEARKKLIQEHVAKLSGKKLSTEKELQEALRDLDRDKLKSGMADKDLQSALQQIREKDFVESANAAANYNPSSFMKTLADLSHLLPHE